MSAQILSVLLEVGANVTGVDLSEVSVDLATKYFKQSCLKANLQVMNGGSISLRGTAVLISYIVTGFLGYTARASTMVGELHRVLRPGGSGQS